MEQSNETRDIVRQTKMQFQKYCQKEAQSSSNKTVAENFNAIVDTDKTFPKDVQEALFSMTTTTSCLMSNFRMFQERPTISLT